MILYVFAYNKDSNKDYCFWYLALQGSIHG